jgi:hypothetical protein
MSLKSLGLVFASLVKGTSTNDNANAGYIGELITSTVATGSAVALTTATTANVTSISLTAGDWDVSAVVDYNFGATTSYTQITAGISLTSATLASQTGGGGLGTDPNSAFATPAQVPTALSFSVEVAPVRVSISATTTVFLVTNCTFTVSTLAAFGTIRARRVR